MKGKIKDAISIGIIAIIGIIVIILVFTHLYPEDFMKKDTTQITMKDLKDDFGFSYVGRPAGEDIPRLSGKKDFRKMSSLDRVTLEVQGIIRTDVYRLKPWEPSYSRIVRTGRARSKRKKEKIVRGLDLLDEYNEYYLLECPDGTYILGQLPDQLVKRIKRGEKVTLPVSAKQEVPQTAQKYLSEICGKYNAEKEEILYSFDDEWYIVHGDTIFMIRFGVACVIFIVLVVIFLILWWKFVGYAGAFE